jgi:diadenylate cyclase
MLDPIRLLRESPITTSTWVDGVDVGVMALLIYGVLSILRGTRAFQILLGLVMLGVMWVVSSLVGLVTVHWMLDNLFVYAVLAVLILFQEDIRQVLATAGGTVFSRALRSEVEEAARAEELVRAVFQLAGKRVGALIALERSASLEPWAEPAHPIGATLSAELLVAIFHPSSPLHDGAVTLEGGRIGHAAVFLPLSTSRTLPKLFGTRHRAAIGLTERTDAVCVLVSEERGTVALVVGGEVTPVVDGNDLRQRLLELTGAGASAQEVSPA